MSKTLTTGKIAPDFELPDQDEKRHKLSSYKGKWVLIYFYPKDFTPGCTTEACEIRDSFEDFEKHNAIVLGVSTDSAKSHKKFAKKYNLPFALLADPDNYVVKKYGVWGPKKMMGREFLGTKRTSFLVNPEGKIVKIYEDVKPKTHAKDVLEDIKESNS